MVFLTINGLLINRKEQELKLKVGVGLVPSDIRYNGKQIFFMILFSFLGGWMSGALGLGGGSFFTPLMVALGVPPVVSSSTSMYMIMFSSAASTVIYLTYGTLNF